MAPPAADGPHLETGESGVGRGQTSHRKGAGLRASWAPPATAGPASWCHATRQSPRSSASVIYEEGREKRNSWRRDSWSDTWRLTSWDGGRCGLVGGEGEDGKMKGRRRAGSEAETLAAASPIPQFHFISSLLLLNFILHFVKILTSHSISFSIFSPPHICWLGRIILPSTPQ